jgi:hypothetical protein
MDGVIRVPEDHQRRIRLEAFTRQVLHELEHTILLRREADYWPDVRLTFTDASARVIAPLVEAVDILESIIWASDGCWGHQNCVHTMEAWQRARALLAGKWQAHQDREPWPSGKEAPVDTEKEDTLNPK